MKQYQIIHQQQILAILQAASEADAVKQYRERDIDQFNLKIKHAEEAVEFLKRERQWRLEHPIDLDVREFK